jgi:hypothetical protein
MYHTPKRQVPWKPESWCAPFWVPPLLAPIRHSIKYGLTDQDPRISVPAQAPLQRPFLSCPNRGALRPEHSMHCISSRERYLVKGSVSAWGIRLRYPTPPWNSYWGGHAKKGGTLSRKGNTELQFSLLTRRGFFFFFWYWGIEPRALHMLGKHSPSL